MPKPNILQLVAIILSAYYIQHNLQLLVTLCTRLGCNVIYTITHQTPKEFQSEYQATAHSGGYEVLETTAAQIYDDLWGFALALNTTMSMISNGDISQTDCRDLPGGLVPLEHFTYNNSMMGCLFIWHLRRTNFSGVSVCLQ